VWFTVPSLLCAITIDLENQPFDFDKSESGSSSPGRFLSSSLQLISHSFANRRQQRRERRQEFEENETIERGGTMKESEKYQSKTETKSCARTKGSF
jgi:hypothetical protein